MFSLFAILKDNIRQLKIIDVGAMAIHDCEYKTLLEHEPTSVVGFEPVERECKKLNEMHAGRHVFLPYLVGNGEERTFHECNYPMTSSFFEPDENITTKFQNLSELMQVVKKERIKTKRLDDIDEVYDADYLKIDVQGAEVEVFDGASKTLENIIIIHTEVEFVPLYINQPLFAEVDLALRAAGFLFHKFYGIAGRAFKPLVVNNDQNAALSQQLWADAVYVKNFLHFEKISPEKLLKFAVIMHDVYRSYDIAHLALQHHDIKNKTSLAPQYLSLLCNNQTSQPQTI